MRVKAITGKGDLVTDIVKALELDAEAVKASQKRLAEIAAKKENAKREDQKRREELARKAREEHETREDEDWRCKEENTRQEQNHRGKYVCNICGIIDIAFDEHADDWICPMCGAGKEHFMEKVEGVPGGKNTSAKSYLKAAENGDADAQLKFGDCLYNGIGIAKDYVKAAEWYFKAALQGNADAMLALARCYECGNGVKQDVQLARSWYAKAAAKERNVPIKEEQCDDEFA